MTHFKNVIFLNGRRTSFQAVIGELFVHLRNDFVDNHIVNIDAAEFFRAVGRDNANRKLTVGLLLKIENRHVESSAAQIKDENFFGSAAFGLPNQAEAQSCRHGFFNQAEDLQARTFCRPFDAFALTILKGKRHADNDAVNALSAKFALDVFFYPRKNVGGDFFASDIASQSRNVLLKIRAFQAAFNGENCIVGIGFAAFNCDITDDFVGNRLIVNDVWKNIRAAVLSQGNRFGNFFFAFPTGDNVRRGSEINAQKQTHHPTSGL